MGKVRKVGNVKRRQREIAKQEAEKIFKMCETYQDYQFALENPTIQSSVIHELVKMSSRALDLPDVMTKKKKVK